MFLIPVAILLLSCGWAEAPVASWVTRPPRPLRYPKHGEYAVIQRLHFLNMLITKDVILKLRHAEKLQHKYKGSLAYELGTLAAGVIDTFKEMLEVYRVYANVTELTMSKYYADDYYDAYHAIQGYYNEILLESDMYYDIIKKYKAKQEAEKTSKDKPLEALFNKWKHLTTKAVSRSNVAIAQRRSNAEEEYKQKLREDKWLKKWDNFVPEIEGVDIDLDFSNL